MLMKGGRSELNVAGIPGSSVNLIGLGSMDGSAVLAEFIDARTVSRQRIHTIAVVAPMSGSGGLYGPSCIAAAQLAVAEINADGGIDEAKLDILFLDSRIRDSAILAKTIGDAVSAGSIQGVIGMCVASTCRILKRVIAGRVPLVYTPPCDGKECAPGVFTLGGTPTEQLVPAIQRVMEITGARRWAMIGSTNVAPLALGEIAKKCIAESGGSVIYEKGIVYNGQGIPNLERLVDELASVGPDIVFMDLIGQDLADFNRAFGDRQLHRRMHRFSEITDEVSNLASGADNTHGIFAVGSYFTNLNTDINLAFKERYYKMHGHAPPAISLQGQSVYEGINFYVSLMRQRKFGIRGPVMYRTARGGVFHSNRNKEDPVYLAEADGHNFQVIEELRR